MTVSSKSLAVRVPWTKLLPILGVKADFGCLPTQTRCPVCNCHRSMIFQDYVLGGQWHYCHGCHSSGDMIDLARRTWNLSLEATVVKLRKLGFDIPYEPDLFNWYVAASTRYSEFHALWAQASDGRLFRNALMDTLASNMGVSLPEVNGLWEAEGPRQVLGGMESAEVQLIFSPNAARDGRSAVEGKVKSQSTSMHRLFRGKQRDWKHVLVVPFYDLPGRIRDYLFIGREAKNTEDFVHRRILPTYSHSPSLGLSFHPGILETKGTVFGLRDISRYLQMQMRHFRVRQQILPLITWFDTDRHRPDKAWKMFSGRKIVLWGDKLTPSLITQAVRSNSYISLAGPRVKQRERYTDWFSRAEPVNLLSLIERKAKPWQELLSEHLRYMPDDELEDLFLQLRFQGEDIDLIAKACSDVVCKKIRSVIQLPTLGLTVNFDNLVIEDRREGWVKVDKSGKEEVISDAKLFIDKVVRHPRRGKPYYKGRIIFREQVHSFCELKEVIDKNCFTWMQEFLIDNGSGVSIFTPSWSSKAVAIATKFHTPKLVTGIEQIGWDVERSAFVLPKCKIKVGGEVRKHDNLTIANAPARDLPLPVNFALGDIAELFGATPAHTRFWTAWCALLHNILAPAFRQPTLGIAVCGGLSTSAMIAASTAMGCRQMQVDKAEELLQAEYEHNYPIAIGLRQREQPVRARALLESTNEDRNCTMVVTREQALVAMINGRWASITDNEMSRVDAAWGLTAKPVLPNYLRWLCKTNFESVHKSLGQGNSFVDCVFDSVIAWLLDYYGQDNTVSNARYYLNYAQCHEQFLFVLCDLINHGKIEVLPKSFEQARAFWIVPEHDAIFVSKKIMIDILEKQWAPKLDVLALTDHLVNGNAIVGEATLHNQVGWLVRSSCWKEAARQYRLSRANLIKLHA